MSSLADVFRVLNRMRDEGIVAQYAIGDATAVLFYAEPTRTYDLDVFVTVDAVPSQALAPLSRIYEWARKRGIELQAEHLMIEGVPVQFLPAYSALVDAALSTAQVHDYDGVPVNVVDPEHLVALALEAGGARRRERAWQLLEAGAADRERLRRILKTHAIAAEIPNDA
ncbi:MAG: hypothetical protein F4Z04_08315 [Acidobacteria bacterium]|nr:hypothetical protein [Acidobacteriota bacterium]